MDTLYDQFGRQIRGFIVLKSNSDFLFKCAECVCEFAAVDSFSEHLNRKHVLEKTDVKQEENVEIVKQNQFPPNEEIFAQSSLGNLSPIEVLSSEEENSASAKNRNNLISKVITNERQTITKTLPVKSILSKHKSTIGNKDAAGSDKNYDNSRKSDTESKEQIDNEKRHHKHRSMKCAFCSRRCINEKDLSEHVIRRHLNRKNSKCEYCNKNFHSLNGRRMHIRRKHLMERPHLCVACPLSFKHREQLKAHEINYHPANKVIRCDICRKEFRSVFERSYHICHPESPSEL